MLQHETILPAKLPRYALAALILFPFAYAVLSLAMGQDANWDLKNYHWYNGYAFLTGRQAIDLLPSQTPYFYNPLLDALLYGFAHAVPAWVASFILSAVQGLNFILLFAISRRVIDATLPRRDLWALLIATFGMLGGGWLAELGTTFYDNILSLGIFGSLLLVLKAFDKNLNWHSANFWGWFVLAGIPVGLATGIKLPTAIFCVGLCGAILLMRGMLVERLARAFSFGIGVLIGIGLSLGYWSYYLWDQYQNPLFPYFNNIFQSPVTLATSARDEQFIVHGMAKLTFPFDWTIDPKKVGEVPFRDLKLPLLYVLAPLVLLASLFCRKAASFTRSNATYVLWVLAIAYAAWLFMFCIYRYAVPLEALAALGLFIAIDRLPLNPAIKKISYAVVIIATLATLQVANWGRTTFSDKFIQVDVPAIDQPENTMLLMGGFQPYSHVIPSFPPEMPVMRIQSNFASPDEPKGINDILRARVAAWPGKFLLLIPTYDAPWTAKDVLPQFGLKADLSNCQPVTPNFSETLNLCPVSRVTEK